jgi:hypothetical protein
MCFGCRNLSAVCVHFMNGDFFGIIKTTEVACCVGAKGR